MEVETFKIEVKESLSKIVEVEASGAEEAISKVKELYRNEEVVLDWQHYVTTEIKEYSE